MGRPKLELSSKVVRSIVGGYTRKRQPLGLVALAEQINVSIPVIRRVLVENGVAVRGRGRPVARKAAKAAA